jgi:hypothetical protein
MLMVWGLVMFEEVFKKLTKGFSEKITPDYLFWFVIVVPLIGVFVMSFFGEPTTAFDKYISGGR